MLSKSHQSRQEGRLGEVQLGVFLETPCGFFVLVDFSQKEQQILLSANHPRATPSAFTSVLPNLGIQGLLLSPPPPPLPPAVPRDKALCCEHPRQYGTAQSPGRKSGLSSKESVIAGQRPPPPNLLIAPFPGRAATCIVLRPRAFLRQAQQMALVSKAGPLPRPPLPAARASLV